MLRGIRSIRFVRRTNARLRRKGPLLAGRHHRRDLTTTWDVHFVLLYVFLNIKKHKPAIPKDTLVLVPYSTAGRFDGWMVIAIRHPDGEVWPTIRARTPLLATDSIARGLLDPTSAPAMSPR
jgi:hypothetical protein